MKASQAGRGTSSLPMNAVLDWGFQAPEYELEAILPVLVLAPNPRPLISPSPLPPPPPSTFVHGDPTSNHETK
jgi:hypothetical protein